MAPTQVTEALTETSVACATSLGVLNGLKYGNTSSDVEPSSLSVIRTDFMSLLALIRAHSTTLSLAFKPPPSYDAVPRSSNDLRIDVTKITGCLRVLAASKQGITFFGQARSQAIAIVDAAQSLVRNLIQTASIDPSLSKDDQTYLLRMGSLHDAIDECKTSFPNDNLDAVLHSWRSSISIIKDALIEYQELSEFQDDGGVDHDDDLGDGMDTWDDVLGVDTSKKLSAEEAEVAKKCWMIVRMVNALHERIISRHLPSLSPSNPTLDSLTASSSAIVIAIDDLTATLYAPQIGGKVNDALRDLQNAVNTLQDPLYVAIGTPTAPPNNQTPEAGMASLTIKESTLPSKDVQWLVNCFAQIKKSIAGV